MSDGQTPREQAAEAAAIRRRWITLGEVLAVVAVTISGLTLWNSYSERVEADAERVAERQSAEAEAATLILQGQVEDDGEALRLVSADADRALQSLRIVFPAALGLDAVETLADGRLPVRAIAGAVRRSSQADRLSLPILVTARFTLDGRLREARGIYQLGLERRDRLVGSDAVRITGVAYRAAAEPDAQAQIDRAWGNGS